ncbi:MAG: hypothetical protein FWG10_07065 [Eubacteriaceae bacterium]|nr:hypothetical protein [Eubacteriaceae bacterium]
MFGSLGQHWNGCILDSVDAVLAYASTAVYIRFALNVHLETGCCPKGAAPPKKAMSMLEEALFREESIEEWFAVVSPEYARIALAKAEAYLDGLDNKKKKREEKKLASVFVAA